MAEYQMQELTLPNEEDKKILFPRMKLSGQVDLNYIASHINYASSFTPGDIIGLTKALCFTLLVLSFLRPMVISFAS